MRVKKEKSRWSWNRAWVLSLGILACCSCSIRNEPAARLVLRRQIVELAKNLAGIPYRLGGVDIDGFDCSGLVFYVYDCFGIQVPRSAREQSRLSGRGRASQAAPGDILVFKLKRFWHSAIYLGNGCFIHAPSSGGWVRVENLNEYWLSRLRKVIDAGRYVR